MSTYRRVRVHRHPDILALGQRIEELVATLRQRADRSEGEARAATGPTERGLLAGRAQAYDLSAAWLSELVDQLHLTDKDCA